MARLAFHTSVKAPPKSRSDGDGNDIHNQILNSLPREECDAVFPSLEFVRLTSLQLLHEVGDTLKSAYFLQHRNGLYAERLSGRQERRSRADWQGRFCGSAVNCGLPYLTC